MRIARFVCSGGWWVMFAICMLFGGFAVWMGIWEALSLAGVSHGAKARAAPAAFVVHAIAGGFALIAGPLQFNRHIRDGNRAFHRIIGGSYVLAVWLASFTGLWNAAFFDVGAPAKILFAVAGALWFATTTLAFRRVRQGKIAFHREWMMRSFSLSLFFVTFEFWVEGLRQSGMLRSTAYPLGVFLGWFVNLLGAELWIRLSPVPQGIHRR